MRIWSFIAALNGFVAVAFAAYAAHGLAGRPDAQSLARLASQFQLFHALALLAADRMAAERRRFAPAAAALFTLGMALFSGSLYVKALTGGLAEPLTTPVGGASLLVAWLALAAAALLRPRR
jgi:uncharacterized membrane protein YgdD (TMEM256/DUF423 family)